MAHKLSPVDEAQYLQPDEVVRRLREEFKFVEADRDAGSKVVADMIKQFERMDAPREIIDAHRAMLGKALRVIVSDRENFDNDYIIFTAMPGSSPFIGYCSRQHEDSATPLLERVCKTLDYRAELM
jgi:hypothetical protein